MRTAGLLLTLIVARAIALAGHHLPLSAWTPIALLWHDAAVVLAFAILERVTAERAVKCLYAILVAYVALNVPVTRALSTPLTWAMWRAARGPLAGSIKQYATMTNVALMAVTIGVAAITPACIGRGRRAPLILAIVLAVVVALGPAAVARVDTHGLDRNAWTALARTALPRLPAATGTDTDSDATTDDGEPERDERVALLRGAAAGRNVVLVSLESVAAQYLALYGGRNGAGSQADIAPNLSQLAQNGITFENAYAVYPESIKGLFSILCSAYPAFDTAAESYAAAPCSSIAAILAARGYRTALFHSGRFGYLGMDAIVRHRGFDVLEDAGDIGGARESSFGIDEASTVARILGWVDALPRRQRFFVAYLPIAGHHPYDTATRGPFAERDEFGRYRNAVHEADAALGALVHGLRARGLERATLWIVLGDHGEAFGQHGGNYGHTFQVFEENVHVPLVIAAPGLVARPLRSDRVVSLVDTAPTIVDLLGEAAPAAYQGRSMLIGGRRAAYFFADYSLGLLGLRDRRFKFIYELESRRSRLFDMDADPLEGSDISRANGRRVERYTHEVLRWIAPGGGQAAASR